MRNVYVTFIDLAINKFMSVTDVPIQYFAIKNSKSDEPARQKLLDIFRSWQQGTGIAIQMKPIPIKPISITNDIGKAQAFLMAAQLYAQNHQVIS